MGDDEVESCVDDTKAASAFSFLEGEQERREEEDWPEWGAGLCLDVIA